MIISWLRIDTNFYPIACNFLKRFYDLLYSLPIKLLLFNMVCNKNSVLLAMFHKYNYILNHLFLVLSSYLIPRKKFRELLKSHAGLILTIMKTEWTLITQGIS